MSAVVIFLIIIILIGAAIGGLYFLGMPPFNKTKRAITRKIKDEDVDEDILREVVLDKILDLEELGETITTEQAMEIQEYFDLDDTHMPYVYETLGVTVDGAVAGDEDGDGTSNGGGAGAVAGDEDGDGTSNGGGDGDGTSNGGGADDVAGDEDGTSNGGGAGDVTGTGSEVVGYEHIERRWVRNAAPVSGDITEINNASVQECKGLCDSMTDCAQFNFESSESAGNSYDSGTCEFRQSGGELSEEHSNPWIIDLYKKLM